MTSGLVVGLGAMGSNHLRVLGRMPGVEVRGVDPDSATGAAHATLEEALEAHKPDFACLSAPVDVLPGLAGTAIDAGVPVMVEKPMAPTEDEALAILRLGRDRGVLVGVGHVERFNPAVRAARDRIADGLLGRIYQVHARRLSPFPARKGMRGVALDLATHDIDVMRFLLGAEVERVYAETAHRLEGEVEDLLCSTLRFTDGAAGLLEVNWLTPTKVRTMTVTGERGMLVIDYLTQDLFFYENPREETRWAALQGVRGPSEGDMVRYALERREPLMVEWEEFLAAVDSGSAAPVSAADGLAALSTARAIQRSGETHEVVVPAHRGEEAGVA